MVTNSKWKYHRPHLADLGYSTGPDFYDIELTYDPDTFLEDWKDHDQLFDFKGVQEKIEALIVKHKIQDVVVSICENNDWDDYDSCYSSTTYSLKLRAWKPMTKKQKDALDTRAAKSKTRAKAKATRLEEEEKKQLLKLLKKYPDLVK